MSQTFPQGFRWGASTSAHQIEGNNLASDLWAFENLPESPLPERSGDACDSFHRWPQDLDIVAELGLDSYRFSIEWARIEPEPGCVSQAMLEHYRAIISGCQERGIEPVVTLHHFTCPRWFRLAGGWLAADAPQLFANYVRALLPILDGVHWVCTINEPNMVAIMHTAMTGQAGPADLASNMPEPDPEITAALISAHREARAVLAAWRPALTGWTVANLNVQPAEGAQEAAAAWRQTREDQFLLAAREDDFIGVQAYTRTLIGPDGQLPPPAGARRTLTDWEFHPAGLGQAVRHTAELLPGVPILVTENGIATGDDQQRIEYTQQALSGLAAAIEDGIDVRGYLHWSLLDNYEWGSYKPTFGLVAVDRGTFARTVKPSARWLGEVARANAL